MDLCLWLMASTCAGYDGDAQIIVNMEEKEGRIFPKVCCCFKLTAEAHETTMTGGSGGSGSCRCCFSFLLRTSLFFFHFPSSLGLSFAQRQPEEGWWGKERASSHGL